MPAASIRLQITTWVAIAIHATFGVLSLMAMMPSGHTLISAKAWLGLTWAYFFFAACWLLWLLWEGMHDPGLLLTRALRRNIYKEYALSAAFFLVLHLSAAAVATDYWVKIQSDPHDFAGLDAYSFSNKQMAWMPVPMLVFMCMLHGLHSTVRLLVFDAACCTCGTQKHDM